MSSPVIHLALGYAIYRAARTRAPSLGGLTPRLALGAAALFSIAPDFDYAVGLLAGDVGRFHNNLTHSIAFGAAASLAAAAAATALYRAWNMRFLALYAFACHTGHLLIDWATRGRGVMLCWPLTEARFSSPWILFPGVDWSQGLWAADHLRTLSFDAAAAALLIGGVLLWSARMQKAAAPH